MGWRLGGGRGEGVVADGEGGMEGERCWTLEMSLLDESARKGVVGGKGGGEGATLGREREGGNEYVGIREIAEGMGYKDTGRRRTRLAPYRACSGEGGGQTYG